MDCNSTEPNGLQKQNCDLEGLKSEALKLSDKTNQVFKHLTAKQKEFQNLEQISENNKSELDGEIRNRTEFLRNLNETRKDLEAHYETLVKLSNQQIINNAMYLYTN